MLPRAVLIGRSSLVLIAAAGLLLSAAPTSPELGRALESLGLPHADSDDFTVDTRLSIATPGYDESIPFPADTRRATFLPGFAGSPPFAIDTSLPRPDPGSASTVSFDLDTRGTNRVWADSGPFTYNDPLRCPGDADLDGDRDLMDAAVFQQCFRLGIDAADTLPTQCAVFDTNDVPGVDWDDFTAFQAALSDETLGGPRTHKAPCGSLFGLLPEIRGGV